MNYGQMVRQWYIFNSLLNYQWQEMKKNKNFYMGFERLTWALQVDAAFQGQLDDCCALSWM